MDQITIIIYKRGNTCGQKWNSDASYAKTVAIFGKNIKFSWRKRQHKCGFVNWCNRVEALPPLEVVPSQQDGPYSCRTILDWCVDRPMVDEKPDAISCNRTAVLNDILLISTESMKCWGRFTWVISKIQSLNEKIASPGKCQKFQMKIEDFWRFWTLKPWKLVTKWSLYYPWTTSNESCAVARTRRSSIPRRGTSMTCTWHVILSQLIIFNCVCDVFLYVTFFKCLCSITLMYFLYIRPVHIFAVYRKGQVTGVTSVVLTLVFHSNDIVACHCFFCTL